MSPVKGILLSCIVVMMHLTFMASHPIINKAFLEQAKNLGLPLKNLQRARESYVQHVFRPENSLELLEGVILIGKNNTKKEIQTSTCMIINCLDHTLTEIVKNFTQPNKQRDGIIDNVTVFINQLRPMAQSHFSCQNQTECVNTAGLYSYAQKKVGFRIINTAERWTEHLVNHSRTH